MSKTNNMLPKKKHASDIAQVSQLAKHLCTALGSFKMHDFIATSSTNSCRSIQPVREYI